MYLLLTQVLWTAAIIWYTLRVIHTWLTICWIIRNAGKWIIGQLMKHAKQISNTNLNAKINYLFHRKHYVCVWVWIRANVFNETLIYTHLLPIIISVCLPYAPCRPCTSCWSYSSFREIFSINELIPFVDAGISKRCQMPIEFSAHTNSLLSSTNSRAEALNNGFLTIE